jgi:hypothetical protein
MIEPFMREFNQDNTGLSLTPICPAVNEGAEWFFEKPSVATREYNGFLMRQTPRGWEYYDRGEWNAVYPKVNYFRQILQVLANTWSKVNSPYLHVDKFEQAESPFTEEYENGEYWLVPGKSIDDKYTLVPVNKAEQISNINILDLHLKQNVNEVYNALRDVLYTMKDDIYGVIFTAEDGKRARIRPRDFDWSKYDANS